METIMLCPTTSWELIPMFKSETRMQFTGKLHLPANLTSLTGRASHLSSHRLGVWFAHSHCALLVLLSPSWAPKQCPFMIKKSAHTLSSQYLALAVETPDTGLLCRLQFVVHQVRTLSGGG